MLVSVISDLHLEFGFTPELPGGDLLLMAGDIFTSHPLRPSRTDERSEFLRARFRKFAHRELSKYKQVLYVTGNHEPYKESLEQTPELLRGFLAEHAPNTRLLDNEVAIIPLGGQEFAVLGTTLWSPCAAGTPDESRMVNAMNDFQVIKTGRPPPPGMRLFRGERAFHPTDAYQLHQEALAWLKAELPKHKRAIVLSHHAPSLRSSARDRYPGSPEYLEQGYCSNLVDLILPHPQIEVWAHGHTHHDVDYRIGSTRVVANHRGYFPSEQISRHFNPAAADFNIVAVEQNGEKA